VRHLAADGPVLRPGRPGELQLPRRAPALALGLKRYLLTTAEGMPVAWCLADPKIGEREIAQDLPGHARDTGALRDGMIVLCDKGLARREMERYAADQAKVLLVRPDRKDEPRRYGNPGGMRQWIESVKDTSRASWIWNGTAAAPRPGSSPASPSGCWPRPPASGTTRGPARTTCGP
jgi:hypothetical protein